MTAAASAPRDRLRARHDRQLALLNVVLGFDGKLDRARRLLEGLEAEQRVALGELAEETGIDVAADLTGVPISKLREALADHRRTATPVEHTSGGK